VPRQAGFTTGLSLSSAARLAVENQIVGVRSSEEPSRREVTIPVSLVMELAPRSTYFPPKVGGKSICPA